MRRCCNRKKMGVTNGNGYTLTIKKKGRYNDMKSKEMRKMIDKYVPMMVALTEMDSDRIEMRAALILDGIVSDTEKTAKKKFDKLYHELFTY